MLSGIYLAAGDLPRRDVHGSRGDWLRLEADDVGDGGDVDCAGHLTVCFDYAGLRHFLPHGRAVAEPDTWLLDRITSAGGVALLVNNEPNVPPKQNPGAGVRQIAFAFPPDVPSGTGAVYVCKLSESIVNIGVVSEALALACEIAVTVNLAGSVLLIVASVGTVFGATYMPLADTVPHTEVGNALQLSCQVTAVLLVPVTLAANCTVGRSHYWRHRW